MALRIWPVVVVEEEEEEERRRRGGRRRKRRWWWSKMGEAHSDIHPWIFFLHTTCLIPS